MDSSNEDRTSVYYNDRHILGLHEWHSEKKCREWFNLVKNYLIVHDLWGVIVDDTTPQDDSWRQKNEEALNILRNSCSSYASRHIEEVVEAKAAWRILHNNFPHKPSVNLAGENSLDGSILYNAICANNWEAAKAIFDQNPSALTAKLTNTNGTPLHVAALCGHLELVEELVKLARPEFLEIVDDYGSTPLAIAASTGDTQIAKCMLDKNRNILCIPNLEYHLPVASAIRADQKEIGHYLYQKTPLEVLKPQNGYLGSRLLCVCFEAGELDIALHLLEQCKDIIFAADDNNWTPVRSIAFLPSAVESASQLGFWKRWISPFIRVPSTTSDIVYVDIQEEGDNRRFQAGRLLCSFISNVFSLLGVKEIYELKLLHARVSQILKLLCRRAPLLDKQQHHVVIDALCHAAKEGLVEFLSEVSKTNPQLLQSTPSLGNRNIFFWAIEYRQAEVFSLIHNYRFKNLVASAVDIDGHCMLHVAAKLTPSNQLNRVSGAALQMQREMQWFKEVKSVVSLGLRMSYGQWTEDIFKEAHKDLRDAGERWMKDTASSCSVVGALIVTIMFAAAFTVPGGNNQNTDYPTFLKDKLYILFVILDALSLFSSTTSVLTFLGVLTSRYAEEDFLVSLPKKLIIGLSTLFVHFDHDSSILFMHYSHAKAYIPMVLSSCYYHCQCPHNPLCIITIPSSS